jgi:hypothetical protein
MGETGLPSPAKRQQTVTPQRSKIHDQVFAIPGTATPSEAPRNASRRTMTKRGCETDFVG